MSTLPERLIPDPPSRLTPMVEHLLAAVDPRLTPGAQAGAFARALRDVPLENVDPARLDPTKTHEDARRMVQEALEGDGVPALVRLVADLLVGVREADQRERWITEGYGHSIRYSEERADEAWDRLGQLEHAVRLVKRATRDVRVGRE